MNRSATPTPKRALAMLTAWLTVTGSLVSPVMAQPATTEGAAANPADESVYACKKAVGRTTLSFKPETDLKDLITWAMGFTCKNFIFDPSVVQTGKKVTLITPNKMTPQEAYQVFLMALSTLGLTVVPKGNVLRIVNSSSARNETIPLLRGGASNADQMKRFIMRPAYMQLGDLSNAMNAIKSRDGEVLTVGSALVITDYESQIREMVAFARAVDLPGTNENIYTLGVQNTDAAKLAEQLNAVLGVASGAPGGGTPSASKPGAAPKKGGSEPSTTEVAAAVPSKILVDDRTNTLIIVSSEAGYMRVRALVKRLDIVMATEGSGSVHVYPLENSNAEELAQSLNAAFAGMSNRSTGSGGGTSKGGLPSAPMRSDFGGAAIEGQVKVAADKPSNSLLVTASGRDFYHLREIIRKLDQPRRQVFIEAAIMEVVVKDDQTIGSSAHGGLPQAGGIGLAGIQTADFSSLNPASLATTSGLIGGLIGAPLATSDTVLGVSKLIPSFGLVVQAVATSSNTNVLSAPHFTAVNNEPTEFSVGSSIPYKSSTFGGVGGATAGGGLIPGLGVNIARADLNLTFKVTPRISSSEQMRLEIEAEIKDRGEDDKELGPTWTQRKLKTQAVLRDQQTVVLAGILSQADSYSEKKVPFLGDIPLLGYLFKTRTKGKRKTNLIIVLTPHLVQDQMDMQQILEKKRQQHEEFVRSFDHLAERHFKPDVDYARKRGLLEEINRTLRSIEADRESLKALSSGNRIEDGMIDYKVDGAHEDTAPAAPPAPAATPATEPAEAPPAAPKPSGKPKTSGKAESKKTEARVTKATTAAAPPRAAAPSKPASPAAGILARIVGGAK